MQNPNNDLNTFFSLSKQEMFLAGFNTAIQDCSQGKINENSDFR
jgi:hypothetical protein